MSGHPYRPSYYKAHRRQMNRYAANYHLKRLYGLPMGGFDKLVIEQCGKCAVCGAPTSRMHVDHDHKSGKIRGLVCFRCNVICGYVEKQHDRIKRCVTYLGAYGKHPLS